MLTGDFVPGSEEEPKSSDWSLSQENMGSSYGQVFAEERGGPVYMSCPLNELCFMGPRRS